MSSLSHLQEMVASITHAEIAPHAARVDSECLWPAHSMKALAEAGVLGLQVPKRLGGHGEGLLGLSVLTETIGQACPSSALCFGMHCVGTAVIAAKSTPYQQQAYLEQIAQGKHITTLALSESGSGAHFYLPSSRVSQSGEMLLVNGAKQFVTNGGHADSYVVTVVAAGDEHELGEFSCLVVNGDTQGLEWQEPWQGLGMRGNSSRGLTLNDVKVSTKNLLGERGDQVWYVFEVVAPYFLMAMAGTYLGVAQCAYEIALEQISERRYVHTGGTLSEYDVPQTRLANMWTALQKTRALVREAARLGDLGHPDALPMLLASKSDVAELAVFVTNEAMTLCGGSAYRENSRLGQTLRDARAAHVMAPTTDLLKLWTARALLGLPLL